MWIIVVFSVILGLNLISCVNITRFIVPSKASHSALLDCKYDLEDRQLFNVIWYKDESEFFKCLPNDKFETHWVDGITLDNSGQNAALGSCKVILMALTPKSSGIYKCEVTTEGPAFPLIYQYGSLEVVDDNSPSISTEVNTTFNSTNEVLVNPTASPSSLNQSGFSMKGSSNIKVTGFVLVLRLFIYTYFRLC